jgi:hypothetical protein
VTSIPGAASSKDLPSQVVFSAAGSLAAGAIPLLQVPVIKNGAEYQDVLDFPAR